MQSLLIIGYVWPEPTATAAGNRMLQIIEQFILLKYKIVFASPAQKPSTAFDLESIDVIEQKIDLNNSTFDVFLKNMNPTIVLFDRFMMEEQFGWRVASVCPKTIRILDSEDLHFLRKARQQAVKELKELPVGVIHSDEAKREIASIYRCDLTFTISEFEMTYLKSVYQIPNMLLFYLPFLIKIDNSSKPVFEERQDFLFIGNFIHAPNWDALLELKRLWPRIKQKAPKSKLHIYGGYPSNKVFQLHNDKEQFLVHGRVDSVNQVMQNVKVCLAPIRFGAGLKGKLIDAMQNDTPFVTTHIGAEGMFGELRLEQSIANTDNDFIKKAILLYTNKDLWNDMGQVGKKVLETRFNKNNWDEKFSEKINELIKNIESIRGQNFIGGMLQHHTLKSSMYLSKWISEKNKI